MDEQEQTARCSFCRKTADDVRKLIAGEGVAICDECVDVCVEIIKDSEAAGSMEAEGCETASRPQQQQAIGVTLACTLCRLPFPVDEMFLIEGKGALCYPCVLQVQTLSRNTSEGGPEVG